MTAEEPSRHPLLQRFEEALDSGQEKMLEHLLRDLEKEGLLEEAWSLFRRKPQTKHGTWSTLRKRLEVRAGVARARRQQREQFDSERCLLQFRYVRGAAVKAVLPPVFNGYLLHSLRMAGLDVALSLEKTPRPLLVPGPALPLGALGQCEWADVVLNRAPGPGWLDTANAAAPEGLKFTDGTALPAYAQTAHELARASRWFWPCPENLRAEAEVRIARFLAAERFEIEKGGKVGGQKTVKRVEVRDLVQAMAWEPAGLAFTTRIAQAEALNPARLLGGILGLEAAAITGMERRGVDLAPDPRLQQQDRFAPKLKNIFEDAVLLGSGGNIILVEEDDEEPLVLG